MSGNTIKRIPIIAILRNYSYETLEQNQHVKHMANKIAKAIVIAYKARRYSNKHKLHIFNPLNTTILVIYIVRSRWSAVLYNPQSTHIEVDVAKVFNHNNSNGKAFMKSE